MTMAFMVILGVATVDPRFARLTEWLTTRGATVGPIRLGKSSIGCGGGAFATRAVEEDEVLLSLPMRVCISARQAIEDDEVGGSLAQLCERGEGGATVAIAGFIAKEWLTDGVDGKYGPYLAMLPWDAQWPPEGQQEQEHIIWWSEAQIDDLFGSEAYDDAVGIRKEVGLACKVLKSLIGPSVRKAYKKQGKPIWEEWKAEEDIDKAVRGAFVAILSRAFVRESCLEQHSQSIEERTLEPFLDMLQHGPESSVRHKRELDTLTGEEFVVVRARHALHEGEELKNCYNNELSPAKFLTRFGFVPGIPVGQYIQELKRQGGGGGWRIG